MQRAFLVILFLAAASGLRADDQLRAVQQQLKDQGFFYGDVDGESGPETIAAIRRYQIRNGLEVTGEPDQETLSALKIPGAAASQPAREPRVANPNVTNADREFLHQQASIPAPSATPSHRYIGVAAPNPTPAFSLAGYFKSFYARTPYETAPQEVQVETLRRAQSLLFRYGYYRASVDGQPGPETQRSLVVFQQHSGLLASGRLDMDTLAVMRLLPGRPIFAPREPMAIPAPYEAPLRGIWVH